MAQYLHEGSDENPPRLLLTLEEAGRCLGVGRSTVYALMRTGELENVKVRRSRRIPAAALDHYVATLRSTTTP